MIVRHARSPQKPEKEFAEWSSVFGGELFVKIAVYADESGTHDKTGTLQGSKQAILGGIIAPREDWGIFCRAWQAVLNKYQAPYFHFREWSDASAIARRVRDPSSDFHKKNPYHGWESKKLDDFVIALAHVANSGNKLIVGDALHTNRFHKAKLSGDLRPDANLSEYHAHHCFISVVGAINIQKPPWKKMPLSFFFDQSGDREWNRVILDTFSFYKAKHPAFKELAFADKKERPHLPLQAADIVAYRTRQIMEKFADGEDHIESWPALDDVLFKSDRHNLNTSQALIKFISKGLNDVLPIPIEQKRRL